MSARATDAGAVLLVEDDASTRDAVAALLAGAGFRIIAADEGRKALELAGVTSPDVVVLDLVTAGMSGWEFLERKVDEPALADVPVVVMTGYGRISLDVAAVLQKPIDPAVLVRTVQDLAARRRARRR